MSESYTLITDLRTENGTVCDLLYRYDGQTSELLEISPKIHVGGLPQDRLQCYFGNYLTLLPPLFDAHMHCYEPGAAWLETVESAVNASMAGGFAGCALMPNTRPCVDDVQIVQLILEKHRHSAPHYRLCLCGSLTKRETTASERKREFLPEGRADGHTLCDFEALLQAGVTAFSDHGAPIKNDARLLEAMQRLQALDALLVIDPYDSDFPHGKATPGKTAKRLGLPTVCTAAETLAVAKALALAKETGCRIHIQHVTCAQSVQMIRLAKKEGGVRVSCETSPPYFILNDNDLLYHGPMALFDPPLRSEADVIAVREGIADGTIDCIVSDHTPCEAREKQDLSQAIAGAAMAETAFALSYHYLVQSGILSLSDLITRMRSNPLRVFGAELPTLAVGQSATFSLCGREELILRTEHFRGKTHCTPFEGLPLSGMICATVHDGQYTSLLETTAPRLRHIHKTKKQ